jgi:hypothetical protein
MYRCFCDPLLSHVEAGHNTRHSATPTKPLTIAILPSSTYSTRDKRLNLHINPITLFTNTLKRIRDTARKEKTYLRKLT